MTVEVGAEETRGSDLLGFFLGFVGVVIFGVTLPMTRFALEAFDPWFITAGRAALAGTCAIFTVIAMRAPLPKRGQWPRLAVVAACTAFGFAAFTALAMQSVPAAHGGVVLGLLPLATGIAALLFAGERPSPAFWGWGAVGACLVIAFTLREGGMRFAAGDFWLLAAGASAAVGYALSGALARTMPGWAVISWALVLAFPISLPLTLILWQPAYAVAPLSVWAAFSYLGLFSMFLGFFAWNAGMALGGVARVGQVQLLQTFVTLGVSAVLLGESVDLEMILFAVAVVATVAASRRTRVARR
ncbi:MAG: EamA/RhaT family transporter [Hyphomicrobiales bacterium]|mgnify:CR=1 FL=1|nr:MAG: EamA/RhaT family transporter [Hyphomicrobiales bacterium]